MSEYRARRRVILYTYCTNYSLTYFFSGQYVRFVSSLRRTAQASASAAGVVVDPWQTSLNWLMGKLVS